jgi:streptomycin 6-kinase
MRRKLSARGAAGACWLHSLGELIQALERDWELTVGAAIQGGSESYIATAQTHQGASVILKLGMPDDGSFVHEIRTLVAAGRGYVRVLRHDQARGAMLME